jgi:hypothetical protein
VISGRRKSRGRSRCLDIRLGSGWPLNRRQVIIELGSQSAGWARITTMVRGRIEQCLEGPITDCARDVSSSCCICHEHQVGQREASYRAVRDLDLDRPAQHHYPLLRWSGTLYAWRYHRKGEGVGNSRFRTVTSVP